MAYDTKRKRDASTWKICAVKMKAQNHFADCLCCSMATASNHKIVCSKCTQCTAPIIHSCENENTVGVYNDNKM